MAFSDLLESSGEYIDFIKLGFGSAATCRWELLKAKVTLANQYDTAVYLGGTLTEIVYFQNCFDNYLTELKRLGIQWIEISDGTLQIPIKERQELIKKAKGLGFKVLTEIGKKDSAEQQTSIQMAQQACRDLDDGASFVIVEGRESGQSINIYDDTGKIRNSALEELTSCLPQSEFLLWEAPLKNQQQALILRFGPNVNLGNLAPGDVIALECLRKGLRSDTFMATIADKQEQKQSLPIQS